MNHTFFKLMLTLYPPYWATGIVVKKITPDFREIIVTMRKRFYNRNYMNSHFGGSLYAMTDPFFMLMMIKILGEDYIVWDKAGCIDFIKPGQGLVTATFTIDEAAIADVKEKTAHGDKYLPEFTVGVLDEQGDTVCRVTKTLYVRKKLDGKTKPPEAR